MSEGKVQEFKISHEKLKANREKRNYILFTFISFSKGPFNNYVDKMRRGGGGQKMFVFVHAQGIKTVHAGGGSKNCKILST